MVSPGGSLTGSFDQAVSWFSRLLTDHVYPEAAQAVEELEVRPPGRHIRRRDRRPPWLSERSRVRPLRARHLVGQRPAPARQHRPRNGLEHVTLRRRHTVRSQDVHLPVRPLSIMESRRLARAEQCLQQRLQILNVRWRALVQDDQIDRELLHPPVLVRAEKLPHDAHVLGLVDLNEHDRKVARNPVSPQRVGAARMTREDVRGGRERPVRRSEEHTSELQSRGHLVCRLLLEKKKNERTSSPPIKKKKNQQK